VTIRKSFTAKAAKDTKERKSSTAKDAKAAKKILVRTKVAKNTPRVAYR
jgi:hypothetical protein